MCLSHPSVDQELRVCQPGLRTVERSQRSTTEGSDYVNPGGQEVHIANQVRLFLRSVARYALLDRLMIQKGLLCRCWASMLAAGSS
jgi:hypothetical protein